MTATHVGKHTIKAENVALIRRWLAERNGLAIWECVDLSNPGVTWTASVNGPDGRPAPKPHYAAGRVIRIITDPADVVVSYDVEVKRFRVGVRRGDQGTKVKVTDGGSRRIRNAVAKAGAGAYHVFDYMTQEAVIMAPERLVPLTEVP
jgi:hypothetical protein